MARNPALTSLSDCRTAAVAVDSVCAARGMRVARIVAVATAPAAAKKTEAGFATATSRPASAGATSPPAAVIQPESTLTAPSSVGVRESAGVTTACVGRVIVTDTAAVAATA